MLLRPDAHAGLAYDLTGPESLTLEEAAVILCAQLLSDTRAAVAHPGTGTFAWQDVRLEEPRPDEVLVRIVARASVTPTSASATANCPTPLPAVLGTRGPG